MWAAPSGRGFTLPQVVRRRRVLSLLYQLVALLKDGFHPLKLQRRTRDKDIRNNLWKTFSRSEGATNHKYPTNIFNSKNQEIHVSFRISAVSRFMTKVKFNNKRSGLRLDFGRLIIKHGCPQTHLKNWKLFFIKPELMNKTLNMRRNGSSCQQQMCFLFLWLSRKMYFLYYKE